MAAEAGRAESVVDAGKLSQLMDDARNGGGGSGVTNHWTLNEVTDALGTALAVARRQNSLASV